MQDCNYPDCQHCTFADCDKNFVTKEERVRQNEMDYEIKHPKEKEVVWCDFPFKYTLKYKEQQIYNHSPKGKARSKRYEESTKGKARKERYERKRLDLEWLERYERLYCGRNSKYKNTNARRRKAYVLRKKYGMVGE